ncbi:carboxylesterase family protein [Mycetocola zhadangensis]|uniref:carboxylesterase family protein n=1 Tax=Mycetocola zhadangensis TaxID=1164595 RepID=UPI00227C32B2|nr:carboxylesterase family protein [Mycetocola zhadangensis]
MAEQPLAFPQRPGGLNPLVGGANTEIAQSEDAFQLRVQAPLGAKNAPVVVFVPGGGFMTGSGNARWFTSPELVERAGVVLVTVNYRIGALGHLGSTGQPAESQGGLRDLIVALRWVNEHIAEFGGNPNQVTLSGDSAGAWYAFALSALEETRGLFTRAALISLPWEPPLAAGAYAERRDLVASELDGIGGLDGAAIEQVLAAQSALSQAYAGRGMALMPAAAGEVTGDLHDYTSVASRLHISELALLSTSEEAAAFLFPAPDQAFSPESVGGFIGAKFDDPAKVSEWIAQKRPDATPKQRMIEAMTLHQFRLANLELAEATTAAGIPTYVASLSLQSPLPGALSPHCFPLPFLFGDREVWHDAPMLDGLDDAVFDQTSRALQDWFLGFVTSGIPSVKGEGGERFDPLHPARVEFDGDAVRSETPSELGLVARR